MILKTVPKNQGIIIFDGYCILCSSVVAILARMDKGAKFYYTTFQSETWKNLSAGYTPETDSIVLLMNSGTYLQSDAVVRILQELRFPWSMLSVMRFIPFRIRELIYQFIAKHRYRIFGKKDICGIPAADVKNRLLE